MIPQYRCAMKLHWLHCNSKDYYANIIQFALLCRTIALPVYDEMYPMVQKSVQDSVQIVKIASHLAHLLCQFLIFFNMHWCIALRQCIQWQGVVCSMQGSSLLPCSIVMFLGWLGLFLHKVCSSTTNVPSDPSILVFVSCAAEHTSVLNPFCRDSGQCPLSQYWLEVFTRP